VQAWGARGRGQTKGGTQRWTPTWCTPSGVRRDGEALPIHEPGTCAHSLVWYTAYACPDCTWQDYEEVLIHNCTDNLKFTYRWKPGKVSHRHVLVWTFEYCAVYVQYCICTVLYMSVYVSTRWAGSSISHSGCSLWRRVMRDV